MNKKFSRAEQRLNVWSAWTAWTAAADDFTRRQTGRLFQILRDAVGERIIQDAAAYARLGDYDERAYSNLARLMEGYREVVTLYEQRRPFFSNHALKSILEGIGAVLSSRLKQFEDMSGAGTLMTVENPVTAEKQSIFTKAAGYAAQHINSQAHLFIERRLPGDDGCYLAFRQALLKSGASRSADLQAAADYLQVTARDFCFKGLYAFYRDGLRFCVNDLNDLHKRTAARYYIDLCENEREVLSTIIKVQVGALEFTLEQNAVSTWEKTAVAQMLTLLREHYQHFSFAAMEIRKATAEIEPAAAAATYQPYDAFEAFLLQSAEKCEPVFPADLDEKKTTFLSVLDKETDALFEQIRLNFFKTVYRFQRIVSEEVIMADEMIAIFERIRSDWPDFRPLPPEASVELEIGKGIAETITIKIESMKENVYAFNENGVRVINEYAAGKKEVVYDDLLAAYNMTLDRWMTEKMDAETKVAAFFERLSQENVFNTYKLFYEKMETEYTSKINKMLLNFKKETLLYEVGTYEEILLYSVSRLRDTDWEPVKQAVGLLDDALKALEMLLKKNNIQVIRPMPHDMFNGREHEVLVVEKQDGFNKGEIIKPLVSGYKQKDTVILRANVVAAK